MIKKIMAMAIVLFSLNLPAWAGGGLAGSNPVTALTSSLWTYTAYVYDPFTKQPGWHTGELMFNADSTISTRNTGSSGDFDNSSSSPTIKYTIQNNGQIDFIDPSTPGFTIGGQLSSAQDKISAVITLVNNTQNPTPDFTPGIVMLFKEVTSPFTYYDLYGNWSGSVFNNKGNNNFTSFSFNLNINTQGKVTGTEYINEVASGTFSGQVLSFTSSGSLTMSIANVLDKTHSETITGQMSPKRNNVTFNFVPNQSGQVSVGIGQMVKN